MNTRTIATTQKMKERTMDERRKIQTNKSTSSQLRVARAVIVQAVRDIVENNRKFIDFYDPGWGNVRCVDHALWFIKDEAVDIGSFSWYCSMVGVKPEYIRNALEGGDWAMLQRIAAIPFH